MADLTIPIIGLTFLTGYMLKRENNVEKFTEPSGNNIYDTQKLEKINKEMLERSMLNYELANKPLETGMIPPHYNKYYESRIGNIPIKEKELKKMSMFNTFFEENKGKKIETDFIHNNMEPFFGGVMKQNTDTTFGKFLENFTGRNELQKGKKEIEKFFDTQPENIYGMPTLTTLINKDRIIVSELKQGEKPIQEERVRAEISGTIQDTIRPKFKDVNELRAGNRLKESYSGVILSGKGNDEITTVSNIGYIEKRTPETFRERPDETFVAKKSTVVKDQMNQNFGNLQITKRSNYNSNYINLGKNIVDKEISRNGEFIDSKKESFTISYDKNKSGIQKFDGNKESITIYDNDRNMENNFKLNTSQITRGLTSKLDKARTTIKETTLNETHGTPKGNIKNTTTMYSEKMIDIQNKPTQKSSVIENKHKGAPLVKLNMGYTKQNVQLRKTTKDKIIELNRSGGPQKFENTLNFEPNVSTKINKLLSEKQDNREKLKKSISFPNMHVSQIGKVEIRKKIKEFDALKKRPLN